MGLGDPHVDLVGEPDDGGPDLGVDGFLSSPWGQDVTREEEDHLRQARWIPRGRKATMQSWFLYLQIIRGLPPANHGDHK